MYIMDTLDEEIMRVFGLDARDGVKKVARNCKVSPSTVRRRITNLIEKGVMRIVGVYDISKVGYPACAVIGFSVSYENVDAVLEDLSSRTEVKWLVVATGRYDIIAMIFVHSFEELQTFVRRGLNTTKGLHEIETFIVLDFKKGKFVPLFEQSTSPQ